MLNYRKIEPADDKRIAEIIRANLEKFHLDIPGTAYFDPELDHLSAYYNSSPSGRAYFVALSADGQVIGGVGIAEFDGIENCAELPEALFGRFRQRKRLRKRADADSRGLGKVSGI